MEPFRYHVYACDQRKPDGAPCCSARGSAATIDALRKELASMGLLDEVQVTVCSSIGLCERGPNLVVYPEGVWYSGVTPADVPELVASHFVAGVPLERLASRDAARLGAEIRTNRDRMLAALRSRDEAGVPPDDLTQTLRGYQESRALLTALELDLFTAAGAGATADEVAARSGTDARATGMLLNALVSMGLLTRRDGGYATTPVSARYLAAEGKDDARAALLHNAGLWARWSTLTDCVRAGTAVAHREMGERGEEGTRYFIAAMHRNAAERARHVVAAVGAAGVRRMLDVGGGSGAYAIAFASASDSLTADVLDPPTVLPITRGHVREARLEGRVRTVEGDLRTGGLGSGYDLVLLSQICHMLDAGENRDLLARCFTALATGGRLVIQEFLLEADKTAPRHAALFSLNMLVGTKGGAAYSAEEIGGWMSEAGFAGVERVRLPGPTGLMVGTRG